MTQHRPRTSQSTGWCALPHAAIPYRLKVVDTYSDITTMSPSEHPQKIVADSGEGYVTLTSCDNAIDVIKREAAGAQKT